ncbi:MAG TPA: pyridoxamine 5'-phosphate oxidase family protein [Sphingomonas sp.]
MIDAYSEKIGDVVMDEPHNIVNTVFPSTPSEVERLDVSRVDENPLFLLRTWLSYVVSIGAIEPAYVTLATASLAGVPSSRTVQLLDVERSALLFSTNFGSRKGMEMLETGRAAVSIYWRETAQSINATGSIVVADDVENDRRFAEENRAIQAARTVSFQGRVLDDEAGQLARFFELTEAETPLVRPDYWKWFRLVPDAVTFWEGRSEALNRRLHYAMGTEGWSRYPIEA